MLKRSFFFSLLFLGCCGQMLAMKKVASSQTVSEQQAVTRLTLKTSGNATLREITNFLPTLIVMNDSVSSVEQQASAEAQTSPAVTPDMVKTTVTKVVLATVALAKEESKVSQEEDIVFPGYIKKAESVTQSQSIASALYAVRDYYCCIPSSARCTCYNTN